MTVRIHANETARRRPVFPGNTGRAYRLKGMGYEWFFFVGALVLLGVISAAVVFNRGRNRAKDAITEAATREQYQHPERYARTEEKFREAAKRED